MELKNQYCEVKFSLKGAEVLSFYDLETKEEYCFDANPKYWTYRNPILFPQIGTYKPLIIDGVFYQMNNHGFVRQSLFKLKNQTTDTISFILEENEETLKQYPFKFQLIVTYTLVAKKLNISYEIINNSDRIMPFAFGLHPAFSISSLNETELVFNQTPLDKYNLIIDNSLKLNWQMFEKNDTLIFDAKEIKKVLLHNKDKVLAIEFEDFNYLAIWTKKDAPFVCIEPWMSRSNVSIIDEFKKIKDIINIEPKKIYTKTYSWEILGGKYESSK